MNTKPLDVPAYIKAVSDIFKHNGFELYLVGGFVRNALLKLKASDLDVASSATPDDVISFLEKEKNITVIPKALDFGTVQVNIKTGDKTIALEHTTFRKDFYHDDGSHRPSSVAFTDDISEDAQRRDFTVNGIYYQLSSQTFVDPLSGIADLEGMTIRAAMKDAEKTLSDDGLRIMRLARFASELNFKVAPDLVHTARRFVQYLDDITPERKQVELKKILLSDIKYQRYKGAFKASKPKRGLMILKEIGALKYIFSVLVAGDGVTQNSAYHVHDVLMHNINTMANTTPSYTLRLAGLLHDIAKPDQLKKTGKMYDHDTVGSEMARKALSDLRTPKDTINHVCALIENHMFDLEGRAKESTIRKKAKQLGFDRMMELADLRRADVIGSGIKSESTTAKKWIRVVNEMKREGVPETIRGLAVDGEDLMREFDLEPGEKIGKLLERLHQITIQKPEQNTYERLMKHTKRILNESEFKHD